MLRIFLAVISVVILLCGFAATAWYLTHPESWNSWSLTSLLNMDGGLPSEPIALEARFVSPASRNPQSLTTQPLGDAPGTAHEIDEEIASGACVLPETVSITRRMDSIIYSWRDEKGQLNFSDTPPRSPTIEVRTTNYWLDPAYFDLNIEYRGTNAVADFQVEFAQDATGIYKILAGLVGEDHLRKVNLNILIYPDRASYVRYANSVNGRNMGGTGGFYSSGSNEAVTFVHAERNEMMQTARHESTHLIATGIFGLIPVWLHEGLAEYFSSLDIVVQSERITLNPTALQRARDAAGNGYPRRLHDFLSLTPATWEDNRSINYAMAEGLVFFLMSNEQSRGVLATLLRHTAENYCQQLDTTVLLDTLYPGGISYLERDFFGWLRDNRPKAPHDF